MREKAFVPGGLPKVSYIPRRNGEYERALAMEIAVGHKMICISGHSGIGKTTLCRRVLGNTRVAWLSGGQLHKAEEFWRHICAHVQAPFTPGLSAAEKGHLLKQFRKAGFTLVMDEFHLIPSQTRREWCAFLKPEIYEGMCPILIGIPREIFVTDYFADELGHRIAHIHVPSWTMAELSQIAKAGFSAAGIPAEPWEIEALARRADGSPLLMQSFCRRIEELRQYQAA